MSDLEFGAFFRALNGGHSPFAWQSRVVEHILSTGVWPEQIVAPTGTGKSFVVDAHIFLNAKFALGQGPRVPRRLCTVVNRRALVDSQADRARWILHEMNSKDAPEVLRRAASALRQLGSKDGAEPFVVGQLRGALSDRSLPVNYPERCAVISATPDMWGSRALLRGYGSTRLARPRDAALLAMDSVMVLDESHLNRQLLQTARRIANLQTFENTLGIPQLQVTETTATVAEETTGASIGVELADLAEDFVLSERVNSTKQLRVVDLQKWNGRPKNSEVIATAIQEIERLVSLSTENPGPKTIGCVVNHVDTAVAIQQKLKAKKLRTCLLVGRMRPFDVEKLNDAHPGLLSVKGNADVDVLIATQTLEVGVDLDFTHLVTELAPASALAQRFGRVNRLGKRTDSEVVILIPEDERQIKESHPPYAGEDLLNSMSWLEGLRTEGSVNPAAMLQTPPPAEIPQRLLFQRLEWADLLDFARTSDKNFDTPDLDLWLHDSLRSDWVGGVVVRDTLPEDTNAAVELLNAVKPRNEEIFPARLSVLEVIKDKILHNAKSKGSEKGSPIRGFLFRESETTALSLDVDFRPNDVLVIEPGLAFTTALVATDKPEDEMPIQPVPLAGIQMHVFESGMSISEASPFISLAEQGEADLKYVDDQGKVLQHSKLMIDTDHRLGFKQACAWYVTESIESVQRDEAALQEWSPSLAPVSLTQHQEEVASRAERICDSIGLEPRWKEIIVSAAEHHDDGKVDPRFQKLLRDASAPSDFEGFWAKSWQPPQRLNNQRNLSGVPPHWRHEQLSALLVAERFGYNTLDDLLRLRIVGCSHGHGRSGFPHVQWEIIFPQATEEQKNLSDKLFLAGEWDEIVEQTNSLFGVYACAFLEAVERAADAQVSSEGH